MRHRVTRARARVRSAAAAAAIGLFTVLGIAGIRSAPAATVPPQVAQRLTQIYDLEGARDTTGLAALMLGDPVVSVRAAAARALGRIQNPGSVASLQSALADKVGAVRAQAAFALGLVGDSTASPAVARRLHTETIPEAREMMVTALGMLGARSGSSAIAHSIRAPRAAERWAAALAAGRARDSTLVDALIAASRDVKPSMRWRVAYSLGRIGDVRGAATLRRLTTDRDETVRYEAARSLGDVGDSSAAPRLVALLADPSWRVRVNAAHALGAVHARRDARSLRPLLRDPSAHVRWEAALALGALGDSGSVTALTAALSDSATGVAQGAAIALLRIQGSSAIPTVAPLLDLLPPFLRSGLIEALGPIPGALALETLIARARDSTDAPEAAGAATALGVRSADRAAALPVLRGLLGSKDFTVVCSASEALGELADTASVPAIGALMTREGTAEDADIRSSAASALAAIQTPAALDSLRLARQDPELRVRQIAAKALGLPPDSVSAGPAPKLHVVPRPTSLPASATVRTERGTIRLAFDSNAAPRTVENFTRLAREGYFNGLAFHRVVPNFVIQDGCPRGDGWGGPGYAIPCEYSPLPYEVGTVGMALSGKDTGGSQWFVTLSPQPRLIGRYTVFGRVIAGMDVAERIMPGDRILEIAVP